MSHGPTHATQPRRRARLATLLALAIAIPCGRVSANALGVTGLTVNQAAGTVTFTLGWDNSWWDGTNWDAAWVFVKFRDCSNAGLDFNHGLLSTTMADHNLGSLQATNAAGTPNLVEAGPNNTGILLRRGAPGSGTISSTVTLRVTNLPAVGNFDVRVFGIEMVFVSQGGFQAGDGNGIIASFNAFFSGANLPVAVSTEAVTTFGIANATALFPKGVSAFYVMKYEISEGQYADFLNATSTAASALRYPPFLGLNRFRLDASGAYPQNYVSQRADRAMNYLSWSDLTAYLDWATLRPMTELQYEKACRGGGGAVLSECAWGSTTSTLLAAITPGAENGAEVVVTANGNLSAGNLFLAGGDGGQGPVRCGIFATATTTTRVQTGASFWGAMELSGNTMELCIGIQAGAGAGPSINGVAFGDGALSALGEHNVASWPNGAAPAAQEVMPRGGSWSTPGACANAPNSCSVSHRGTVYVNAPRQPNYGGRGIR